jgi:hypothetical protein
MSKRALEFVETWISEKIEKEGIPKEGEESPAKQWADECIEAANEEGIPASEINEAFEDLADFIEGEIEEAGERDKDEEDEEEDDEEEEEDEDDEEEKEDEEN